MFRSPSNIFSTNNRNEKFFWLVGSDVATRFWLHDISSKNSHTAVWKRCWYFYVETIIRNFILNSVWGPRVSINGWSNNFGVSCYQGANRCRVHFRSGLRGGIISGVKQTLIITIWLVVKIRVLGRVLVELNILKLKWNACRAITPGVVNDNIRVISNVRFRLVWKNNRKISSRFLRKFFLL